MAGIRNPRASTSAATAKARLSSPIGIGTMALSVRTSMPRAPSSRTKSATALRRASTRSGSDSSTVSAASAAAADAADGAVEKTNERDRFVR